MIVRFTYVHAWGPEVLEGRVVERRFALSPEAARFIPEPSDTRILVATRLGLHLLDRDELLESVEVRRVPDEDEDEDEQEVGQ